MRRLGFLWAVRFFDVQIQPTQLGPFVRMKYPLVMTNIAIEHGDL